MPERVQLQRTKGWRMPENTVKVDRSTCWGNPYAVGEKFIVDWAADNRPVYGKVKDHHEAVQLFRHAIESRTGAVLGFSLGEVARLRGKNLACWCKPGEPCHADVLLEIANRPIAIVPSVDLPLHDHENGT